MIPLAEHELIDPDQGEAGQLREFGDQSGSTDKAPSDRPGSHHDGGGHGAPRLTGIPAPSRLRIQEETLMAKLMIEVTPEKLAELLGELPPEQLKIVLAKVAERREVREWMRLGEFGFQEWLTEPDLYADDRPAR